MKNTSIDIILSTYNGEKYIVEQLNSILNQSYSGEYRILIRDDGSTDATVSLLKKYTQHTNIVWVTDDLGNVGLVKSYEILLKNSTADYIFFADQDDVWFNNKIEIFLKHIDKETVTPLLLHSNCWVTDVDLQQKHLFIPSKPQLGLNYALFNYYVQGASMMISKELKDKLLPFPATVYVHDRYIHLMAELVGIRIYIDLPTMYYRQHNQNSIGSTSLFTKIKNNLSFRSFYLIQDKNLMESLPYKNELLEVYKKITHADTGLFKTLYLIHQYNIKMRVKEKVLLILNKLLRK